MTSPKHTVTFKKSDKVLNSEGKEVELHDVEVVYYDGVTEYLYAGKMILIGKRVVKEDLFGWV